MLAVKPVKVLLICQAPHAPVDPSLPLYCVVQPVGAVVALTVMLVVVGVPLTTRCVGGFVVNSGAVVCIFSLATLSVEFT